MKLSNIKIVNFRRFHNLSVNFDPQMNVIVGNNGAGKSSILDAVSIGIGSFLLGIEGVHTPGIHKTDVRLASYEIGSVLDRHPQFPVIIECTGSVANDAITWTRQLNTESGKTTYGEAYSIKNIASSMQKSIRDGNNQVQLPIISYYGTGRLWAQKREKNTGTGRALLNRLSGYTDCLSSMSNEKLMIKWFQKMTMQELQAGEKIPELTAVETAVSKCYQGSGIPADNVKVRFNIKSNELEITYVDKEGKKQKYSFHELSDGFKNTLSLVADIAYRMAVLNPQFLSDVLKETSGIVIIDEIDQHLHPLWQKNILNNLMNIFPKVQFIVTTHSPSVISSANKNQLIVLDDDNACSYSEEIYGKDVNSVLYEIMGVTTRPDDIDLRFSTFYDLLEKEDYDNARILLNELTELLGKNDNGIISATVSLDFESDNG